MQTYLAYHNFLNKVQYNIPQVSITLYLYYNFVIMLDIWLMIINPF